MRALFTSTMLLLALASSSCKLQEALTSDEPTEDAGATSAPAPSTPGAYPLQPAPAGYSAAAAERYYKAQLLAQKQGVPRKQKNSNNTTNEVTQEVHNGLSTAQLLVSWAVFLALGGAITLGYLYLRGWRKPEPIVTTVAALDFERRRFNRIMAEKKL